MRHHLEVKVALYAHKPNRIHTPVWNHIVDTRDEGQARGYFAGLVDYDAAFARW